VDVLLSGGRECRRKKKENCIQRRGLETFGQLPGKIKYKKWKKEKLCWFESGQQGVWVISPQQQKPSAFRSSIFFTLLYIERCNYNFFPVSVLSLLFSLIRLVHRRATSSRFFFLHRNNKGKETFFSFFWTRLFCLIRRQWTINPSSHVSHFLETFSPAQTNSFQPFQRQQRRRPTL
jgi:hypothetical protein